jgi:hypothetical protein
MCYVTLLRTFLLLFPACHVFAPRPHDFIEIWGTDQNVWTQIVKEAKMTMDGEVKPGCSYGANFHGLKTKHSVIRQRT